MKPLESSRDALSGTERRDRQALDLAVHIGRKTALLLCGALGVALVVVPLLALLAPELSH